MESLQPWLDRWNLVPDGEPFLSGTRQLLLPVRSGETPAMLKLTTEPEERAGADLLVWWDGVGAVRVLAREGDALLMERAADPHKLVSMSESGQDEKAVAILVSAATRLHTPRHKPPPPTLMTMEVRFRELFETATKLGGRFVDGARVARLLIDSPQEEAVLHGDIQHHNVLDFGEHGWLVIDPKGIHGERGYDFANTFCNPTVPIALETGRVPRLASLISQLAKLDRNRLLMWVYAYGHLSASWNLGVWGIDDPSPMIVADRARAELESTSAWPW